MAQLNKTNLVLVAAPLPPDFEGDLQDLYEAMVFRFQILSPVGTNFFVTGDVEPSSNQGPWLKNGNQWWVFNEAAGGYVPIDISASTHPDFFTGPADPGTPGTDDPVFWVRTNGNHIVGLYGWNGSAWVASANAVASGPTTARPASPVEMEEFFDTTINVALRFERGAWRTSAGSPGDVKSVTHTTLADALRINPGWDLLGRDDEATRGRLIGQAAKDPGATPADSFTTSSGITARAAGDKAGEETHILASDEIEPHTHLVGIASPSDAQGVRFHRADAGDVLAIPSPQPPNYLTLSGDGRTAQTGTSGPGTAGLAMITSPQLLKTVAPGYCGTSVAHNNLPQTLFLWTLYKL
jgi:hypothetical protein